jgi:hypothetical protein
MLEDYVKRLQISGKRYTRLLLIAHEEMRILYEKAGFEWLGESAVAHGSRKWYEMRRSLEGTGAVEVEVPTSVPPSISSQTLLDLLRAPRNRPSARLLSTFANTGEVLDPNEKSNKYDLLCPREGCGCVILKEGAGTFIEKESTTVIPDFQSARFRR